jgi:ABC-type iron transport system FetAB ATPase subunit
VSGSGKTLLLRSIADLDEHQGECLLNGISRSAYPAFEWRSRVALVPAESRWWHELVGDHLICRHGERLAVDLLESCGFGAEVLNWEVQRLSSGEKQRLSVVRALVREPAVLLLDEIGSSLDGDSELLLEQMLMDYRRRKRASMLWVSHNSEQLARVADTVLVLHPDRLEVAQEDNKLQFATDNQVPKP